MIESPETGVPRQVTFTCPPQKDRGIYLSPLFGSSGWLLIARHRITAEGTSKTHVLLSGWSDRLGLIGSHICFQLISCRGSAEDGSAAPPDKVLLLMQEVERRDTTGIHDVLTRQLEIKRSTATREQLTSRIEELNAEIADVRRRLRNFTHRTPEYLGLQEHLVQLLREDRTAFVRRRQLRLNAIAADKVNDVPAPELTGHETSIEPIATIRWRLEQ